MIKLTGRQIWHRCTHLSEESDTEFNIGYYKSDEVDLERAKDELELATAHKRIDYLEKLNHANLKANLEFTWERERKIRELAAKLKNMSY